MKMPEWLKPGIYGGLVGAIALAIVGFSWGGWMTGGGAEKMAMSQAKTEVVAALVPICLEQSKQDPALTRTMATLKDASNYKRNGLLMDAGWATMPGSTEPNSQVASACMEALAAQF